MNNNDERADEQSHRVLCSWCGATMRPGREPVSHSICAGCVEGAEREAGLRSDLPAPGSRDDRRSTATIQAIGDGRALGRVLYRVGRVDNHGVEPGGEWREAVMRAGRAIDRERRQSAEERWRAYRRREAWEVAGTVAFGVGLGVVAWLMMVW